MLNVILFSDPTYEWKFKISYLIYILGGIFLAAIFIWIKYQDYRAKKYCEEHDINSKDSED